MLKLTFSNIKPILQLAWPIIISNLSQILLNLIDSMIVGQIGYKELASSGLINNVLSLPMVACMGLSVVLAPLMADLMQRNKSAEGRQLMQSATLIVLLFTLLIILVLFVFKSYLYKLGQEKEIVDLGIPYFFWMCWSLLPMMLFYIIKQFYDGMGLVKIPMMIALFLY